MSHTRAKRRAAARDMARDEIFSGEFNDDRDILSIASASYDPKRHDEDSVFFDNSYTGPSERELSGGCNRCGGFDDCYCPDPPTKEELRIYRQYEKRLGPQWTVMWAWNNGSFMKVLENVFSNNVMPLLKSLRSLKGHDVKIKLFKYVDGQDERVYELSYLGYVYEI